MVGAAPTGDAATTSEWSTIVLPTKVHHILEVWHIYHEIHHLVNTTYQWDPPATSVDSLLFTAKTTRLFLSRPNGSRKTPTSSPAGGKKNHLPYRSTSINKCQIFFIVPNTSVPFKHIQLLARQNVQASVSLCKVLNSLRPSDAIWWQRSGSTLAQVMACCLTAPSHYLNQGWLIISKIQINSSDGNFTRDTSVINDWN